MIMGSVFFLTMRLLLTEGLATFMLLLASIFLLIGLIRWKGRSAYTRIGILGAVILLIGGLIEFWGYTAAHGEFTRTVHTITIILATLSAACAYLISADIAADIAGEERDTQTEGILKQRKWWIGIGYLICGGWTVFDLLTGLFPNVGIVMRIAAIIINVFYLSALFQVRKLIE